MRLHFEANLRWLLAALLTMAAASNAQLIVPGEVPDPSKSGSGSASSRPSEPEAPVPRAKPRAALRSTTPSAIAALPMQTWGIQMGSFLGQGREAKSEDLRQKLKQDYGIEAEVLPSEDRKYYRVIVAGYGDKESAAYALAVLKGDPLFNDAFVRTVPTPQAPESSPKGGHGPLSSWEVKVNRLVQKNWDEPANLQLEPSNMTATVAFTVGADGKLKGEPEVIKHASSPELGESAVRAIKRAAPFPPLAMGERREQRVVCDFSLGK